MSRDTLLKPEPEWHRAAQTLIEGLVALDDADARVELLEGICAALGDQLYPAFLHILHTVSRFADDAAAALLAATLVDCLISGRLPAGKLSAWGSTAHSGDSAFGQTRTLGPVEYVCAWYAQPSGQPPLSRERFADIASRLFDLINHDDRARRLYARKLLADADDPLSGSLASQTRTALRALADTWQHTSDSAALVDSFTDALQGQSRLAQLGARPFSP